MSREYIAMLPDPVAAQLSGSETANDSGLLASAPSVQIHYVSAGATRAGDLIQLTSNQRIVATAHHGDACVAPGRLDIIIVPGPDPTAAAMDPEARAWLAAHAARRDDVDVLSVCTGIFVCGEAGLLGGRQVCGPRGLQSLLRERFGGDVELRGHELRWVQDGNLWSSGELADEIFFCVLVFLVLVLVLAASLVDGRVTLSLSSAPFPSRLHPHPFPPLLMETHAPLLACAGDETGQAKRPADISVNLTPAIGGVTNGNDLVAAYARQSRHFPRAVVEFALATCEVGDRSQEYGHAAGESDLGHVGAVMAT
jgi:putative intracellular protease/amidase